MKKEIISQLHSSFESIARTDAEPGIEFWCARDLQLLLGYAHWRNFLPVIEKAMNSCKNAGHEPCNHFAHARKMVSIGSGAERPIDSFVADTPFQPMSGQKS
ncbi:MAG: hypothetical protein AABZ47_16735 [Planctomycetota bacterium]